jgi:hypothetical protein
MLILLIGSNDLAIDHIEQQRDLTFASDRVGQKRGLQRVIVKQLADRLEVVQQVRGIFKVF